MEVLARLQRREPGSLSANIPPDKIITVKVTRKRSHPYEPARIPDDSAEQRKEDAKFVRKMFNR